MTISDRSMHTDPLAGEIRRVALELGFDRVGIAGAGGPPHGAFFPTWLSRGCHGEMAYLERNLEKRMDVRKLCPGAESVIAVAHNYHYPHQRPPDIGKISRYALGRDYHKVVKKKLSRLLCAIQKLDGSVEGRVFVDTAPIMDKQWAVAAGLGWQGKHTNLIVPGMGSWVFLGEIVVNRPLAADVPLPDRCGTCHACIDACPTGALTPYVLDARKCISYLTIELRGPIPPQFHGKMDHWVFGCDICQEVCPWNKKFARLSGEIDYFPRALECGIEEFAAMDESAFRERFQGTPVMRARWDHFVGAANLGASGAESVPMD